MLNYHFCHQESTYIKIGIFFSTIQVFESPIAVTPVDPSSESSAMMVPSFATSVAHWRASVSYAKIRASRNPSSVKHNKWWNYTQINSSRNFGRIFESLSWKTGFKNPAFNQQQQQPVSTLNLFIYTCISIQYTLQGTITYPTKRE